MAAGGAVVAVTAVDGKCVLAEAGGDENGVAQSERHNELRVDCSRAGNTLGLRDSDVRPAKYALCSPVLS